MSSDPKTSELCQKMATLRRSIGNQGNAIHQEVHALKGQVSKALDVRHQVLSHPVVASMFAGVLGFFLIPKRKKKANSQPAENLEKLIADLREKFGVAEPVPESKSDSWTKTIFELAKGFAMQTLISQGKKRLVAYMANLATQSNRNNPDQENVENAFGRTHSGASS